MGCFWCFQSSDQTRSAKRSRSGRRGQLHKEANIAPPHHHHHHHRPEHLKLKTAPKAEATNKNNNNNKATNREAAGNNNIAAQTFSFRELATATKNFRRECLLVQVVAVKQLDRNGLQGNREFLVEVLMLSLLHHQNLVNLIGYCADGEQRLLVYEYMQLGSLEDHLLDLSPGQRPLDWYKRMKIALGAAKGLEYLHDKANPPVIYRDLKSSNILLDKKFNAKLSDFGLAKLGPVGDKSHVSSRVMGTYGYCAPEYQRTGQLTVKSDVYSFGVVLLELITGRRAIDNTKSITEQNLVSWACPMFKDPQKYPQLADPLLKGDFPVRGLHQAVAVAAMCLNEEPSSRPFISDIVSALSFLGTSPDTATTPCISSPSPTSDKNAGASNNGRSQDEEIMLLERQRAVAEAMEWGSNSRHNTKARFGSASSL
ncbi:hypothetical protein TIFTF001_019497 [Ficus carica]|uniref:Protein kinase domain-containing protein n=1 Tax=Ficus carica TaxID=3494 RepID=A0AA88DBT9_FICCA|nr:hypothetical protein TIFTF001_019497 [Ficus carica]